MVSHFGGCQPGKVVGVAFTGINGKIGQIMSINSVEGKRAAEHAFRIRTLAEKFARVRGEPMTLVLRDKKRIRNVHIAPEAIALGNLAVDVRPQALASGPRRHTIYDLSRPPIAANDVAEMAILAELLERLVPNFPEKE